MSVTEQTEASPVQGQGKRERLVSAACDLVYRQGIARTTLADIAQAADVPVGNVYYYFRTKDAIIDAVVRAHVSRLSAAVVQVERRHRTPQARLKALMAALAEQRDLIALYGCLYGTLSSELAKGAEGPDVPGASLVRVPLEWAERQFRDMGRADAGDLAVEFVASYQGSAVLSSALGQPDLMARQVRRLARWIEALQP